VRVLRKYNDRSIDGMFVFCNPCARAELHQQKRTPKLVPETYTFFFMEKCRYGLMGTDQGHI